MNNLTVLYEDNHIIVVEKPPNILSQSDITGDIDMLTMVKKYIKEKYHKPGNVYIGLVHRLDRPVGGLMVFAKTSKAAARLSEQIRKNQMKKVYLAVVKGKMDEVSGTFIDYLKRDQIGNTVISSKDAGKYAELDYRVLQYDKSKKRSLVEIHLKTGRHHQIRVQFASRKHPLCGDQRYGTMDNTQIALYAYCLELIHPTTKEILTFVKKPVNLEYMSTFTL